MSQLKEGSNLARNNYTLMLNTQKHITPLGNYNVPTGWPMKPYKRPYGGTPGPPVMYEKPSDPEDEGAGYGYSNAEQIKEKDVFFYHSDHLGSTSYITHKRFSLFFYYSKMFSGHQ